MTAHLVDRATGRALAPERADVLIGADGIHSTVRRLLYPDEAAPVASGSVQWRGAIEAAPYLDGRTQVMIGHYRQRMVIYPMGRRRAGARAVAGQLAGAAGRQERSPRPRELGPPR